MLLLHGSSAALEVADTGTGISPENLERILEPAYTTKNRETSSGLGLTVVQKMAGLYGAKLSIESNLGLGSVFRVEYKKQ